MLLAIDSATRRLSLALHDGVHVRAELAWETANQHTVELTPAIQMLCARAGVSLRQPVAAANSAPADLPVVTRIAVCQGPGSFSGLRVGVATAKGLAAALHVPLIGVPTLAITAAGTPHPATVDAPAQTPLVAVAQAGRGRVCACHYRWVSGAGWQPTAETVIIGWEPLLAGLTERVLINGELEAPIPWAASAHAPYFLPAAWQQRRAATLADLAWQRPAAPPAAVMPIYINQPGLPHP
jgi:tRNA threonylcarbamoyladenosine biosynthesis protein TsaB